MVRKFLFILILCILLNTNVLADNIVTFKCKFDKENYEYVINWDRDKLNTIYLRSMPSKQEYFYDTLKGSAEITVIDDDRSYNFRGFKNNRSTVEHYFIFVDGPNSLFAYLKVSKNDETGRPIEFLITSHDSGIDEITKGICQAIY